MLCIVYKIKIIVNIVMNKKVHLVIKTLTCHNICFDSNDFTIYIQ